MPSFLETFSFLKSADQALLDEFVSNTKLVHFPPGMPICMEGDQCGQMALVLEGSARVYKMGESGREITLYRIQKGETCILTASCILSQQPFPAFAETETELKGLIIPSYIFQSWMSKYEVWRHYIFDLLSKRLAGVITVVEEVTFRRLDARVAQWILKKANVSPDIHTTHEMLATELGSSREVVSRVLKEFENTGTIVLTRGTIHVKHPANLEKYL